MHEEASDDGQDDDAGDGGEDDGSIPPYSIILDLFNGGLLGVQDLGWQRRVIIGRSLGPGVDDENPCQHRHEPGEMHDGPVDG